MKAELLKRSHELVETQRSLRKLQEVDLFGRRLELWLVNQPAPNVPPPEIRPY